MKLYEFEKYYLHLIRYKFFLVLTKSFSFFEKIWKNQIGKVVLTILLYILALLWICVVFLILIHFVIGVNVFLEKVHLKQYRIEKIPIMKSEFDLRPYF